MATDIENIGNSLKIFLPETIGQSHQIWHVALSSGSLSSGFFRLYAKPMSNLTPLKQLGGVGAVTSFTDKWAHIEKTLEIFLYLAIRPRVTNFCMWLFF